MVAQDPSIYPILLACHFLNPSLVREETDLLKAVFQNWGQLGDILGLIVQFVNDCELRIRFGEGCHYQDACVK